MVFPSNFIDLDFGIKKKSSNEMGLFILNNKKN